MARVKDLWFSDVPVRGADGKTIRDDTGHVVTAKRKTAKHPDRGGNRDAKRWLACWSDPDGREASKAFHKQQDASNYARKMEADAERDEYVDPKAGKELFGPLAAKYIRLRVVGRSTRTRYESINRNHVEPYFGGRRIGSPRPSEITEWLNGPMAKASASIRHTAYIILAGTFDLAVADKLRRDNPARSPIVPVPARDEPKERAVWTPERVWQVRDLHPEPYRAIVDCCAGLGLRRGCAFGLAVDDFDFEAEKVHIRRQVQTAVKSKGGQVFKLPKGGKERTVPLPRGVAAAVKAHMAKYPPVECTLPWLNEDGTLAEDPVTVKLVFVWHGDDPRTSGKPIIDGSYNFGVWLPVLAAAGIIPQPVDGPKSYRFYVGGAGRDNGMHALRHLYETVIDDGGVSQAGQVEFMGHSRKSQVITTAVYGHVTEETFRRARNAVDRSLYRLRPVRSKPAGTVAELRAAR